MSDRRESSFTLTTPDGEKRTYTILSAITPDDLIRIGFKAYVREKRGGEKYSSPFSREVRLAITQAHVAQRS
jgi:hypothetical protein